MNIERLNHLITILENVDPDEFDITVWECGTVACAAGHACRDPEFNRQGLTMRGWPNFAGCGSASALEAFFGLLHEQEQYIFHGGSYDTPWRTLPKDVIAHIKETMK